MPVNEALETISRRLRKDDKLPVLPQILTKVREVTRDPQSSASDLAEIILKDQALTGKLLKIVNSSYYRQGTRKVTTVTQAIVVLGFENVRNITLAASVHDVLSRFMTQEMMVDFWAHSLATGVMAQMLAQKRGLPITEEAFVGGLLHDVGKLILAQYFPNEYGQVWRLMKPGPAYLHAERNVMSVDHVDVGVELASKWRFDETLTSCIRFHHDLGVAARDDRYQVARFVHYGNLLATGLFREVEGDRSAVLQGMFRQALPIVGVAGDVVQEMLSSVTERMEELAQCFDIPMKELPKLPPQFRAETVVAAEAAAQAASIATTDLQAELMRQQQWMAYLTSISEALVAEPGANKVLRTILEAATKGLGVERAVLATCDAQKGRVRVLLAEGEPVGPELLQFETPLSGNGILARAIVEGRSQNVPDTDLPVYAAMVAQDERRVLRSRALAAIPVRRKGQVVGALLADNPASGDAIPDKDIASLQVLANYVSIVLGRV